jgi:molybdopterin/thiamine biosynthesis adenylyltransferase
VNDAQLLRYSRHILLDELGDLGQQRLLDSHAVVVGAGGLGCSAALFLASSGVGRITLIDHDDVDLTNLQRQISHSTDRIGQAKVLSAQQSMLALNPDVHVHALPQKADASLLDALLPTAQVVLDCSDNFNTRHMLNAASVKHHVPLVSGAVIRWMDKSPLMTPDAWTLLATPVCSHPTKHPKKSVAPPWVCWRPWSASSAACKLQRL